MAKMSATGNQQSETSRRWASEAGIVSLITSIVVGLLLVVITSGGIAITAGELRQASDYDNSIKAYYAAEAGAEDAIAHLRRGLADGDALSTLVKDSCAPYDADAANLSGDSAVQYTCQIVSVNQNQLTDNLLKEQSAQIDLSGADSFTQLRFRWNQRGSSDPQGWVAAAIPNIFPVGSGWANTYPAVFEFNITSFPNGVFQSTDIDTFKIVLKPNTSGVASPINFNGASNPTNVACAPGAATGDYDCSVTLSGFTPATTNYIVRLNTRYSSAHYQLEALDLSGNDVTVPNAQLSVDVTGRAGDVSRRVLLKAPLSGQSPINFVLLANDNICKILQVSNVSGAANSESGC